ncbi:PP0621 family protein [Sutterella sp.]|uniref:PP0621 family protein n=1 Tax=Sutterella sp. TaxID=1981025 RepID=UPI0026DFE5F9|nr:PP0621 family protein [Sutterella sp.]MDO5531851.1 PP0621 family protein [Sutterella sp.]
MSRILFFLGIFAVIAICWTLSRKKQELSIKERDELEELRRNERGRKNAAAVIGEPMEKCEECGLYIPKRDVVRRGSHTYCSARCRDAAAKRE